MNNPTNTILITGCSSGFGKASVDHFLNEGWNVIATMRSPQPTLFPTSDSLLVTALDVTRSTSIEAAIAEGIARFGRIDVLVNNAGIGLFGALEAMSDDVIREVFETNTFGTMAAARAIIPHMRERGSGVIINVTSSVALGPVPMLPIYVASKMAVEGFSEALTHELALFGVQVKLVEPGLAPSTSFASNGGARSENSVPPAYAEFAGRIMKSIHTYPLPVTTEDDVARVIHAAATDCRDQLRYPAGGDAQEMARLRRTMSDQGLRDRVREIFGGAPVTT